MCVSKYSVRIWVKTGKTPASKTCRRLALNHAFQSPHRRHRPTARLFPAATATRDPPRFILGLSVAGRRKAEVRGLMPEAKPVAFRLDPFALGLPPLASSLKPQVFLHASPTLHSHRRHLPAPRARHARSADEAPASPSLKITFPNPNVFQSPYTWRNENGSAIAPTGGSYLKGVVQGTTTLRAAIDTALNEGLPADDMPSLKITIDDRPAEFVQFPPGAKQVTLGTIAPEAKDQPHRYRVEVIGGNQTRPDGWQGTSFQTKIDSLEVDAGATPRAGSPFASGSCWATATSRPILAMAPSGRTLSMSITRSRGPGRWPLPLTPSLARSASARPAGFIRGRGAIRLCPSGGIFTPRPPADLFLAPRLRLGGVGGQRSWRRAGPTLGRDHRLAQGSSAGLSHSRDFLRGPLSRRESPCRDHGHQSFCHRRQRPHVHLIDLGRELESAIPFRMGQATWLTGDGLHLRAVHHRSASPPRLRSSRRRGWVGVHSRRV